MRTATLCVLVSAAADPITYMGKNGKQCVVVDADDSLVAFSLP
jgi:hypothetical protein